MLRIRWFDPEEIGQPSPVAWPQVAAVSATLFLNFAFWMGPASAWFSTPPMTPFVAAVALASVLAAALFFAGPALALQAQGQSLFAASEVSLGSIPAWGVRIAGLWFLTSWISTLVSMPASWFLPMILRRHPSTVETLMVAAALLALTCFTGFQSLRTRAKLAAFTNRLAIAILIAALLRVRAGLPTAVGIGPAPVWSSDPDLWRSMSQLTYSVAPLALFAAGLARRVAGRRALLITAGMGIALPLCATLLLVGVIEASTYPAGHGQPSIPPNVGMALWAKAASSALPLRMVLVSITLFGALRFCLSALAETTSIPFRGWRKWIPFSCLLAAVWSSVPFDIRSRLPDPELASVCLTAAAAILAADFLTTNRSPQRTRRIDTAGTTAMLAALVTSRLPWFTDPWWHPSLLPAYFVAFAVTFFGRRLPLLAGQHRDAGLHEGR